MNSHLWLVSSHIIYTRVGLCEQQNTEIVMAWLFCYLITKDTTASISCFSLSLITFSRASQLPCHVWYHGEARVAKKVPNLQPCVWAIGDRDPPGPGKFQMTATPGNILIRTSWGTMCQTIWLTAPKSLIPDPWSSETARVPCPFQHLRTQREVCSLEEGPHAAGHPCWHPDLRLSDSEK